MRAPILVAAACSCAFAADNTLTPEEQKAGFKLLFDGHTMSGWRDPAAEKPPGDSWAIEDGCLRTNPKPRISEDLISKESFGDFELKFDWRISAHANTGIKYRIQRAVFMDKSKVDWTVGRFETAIEREVAQHPSDRATLAPGAAGREYTIAYEFQLIDDAGETGLTDHVHDTGSLYAMIPPKVAAAHPPGKWNVSRLVVKGDGFEHWINGVKVLDGSLHSPEAIAGNAKRWAAEPTVRNMLEKAGPGGAVSLQHHGSAVWFKNLKIRRL